MIYYDIRCTRDTYVKLNEDDILLSGPVTDCHEPNKSLKIVLGNGDAL